MDNTNIHQFADGLQSRCLQQIEAFVVAQDEESACALLQNASIALRKYKEMLALDSSSLSPDAYSISALAFFTKQINLATKKLEFFGKIDEYVIEVFHPTAKHPLPKDARAAYKEFRADQSAFDEEIAAANQLVMNRLCSRAA